MTKQKGQNNVEPNRQPDSEIESVDSISDRRKNGISKRKPYNQIDRLYPIFYTELGLEQRGPTHFHISADM